MDQKEPSFEPHLPQSPSNLDPNQPQSPSPRKRLSAAGLLSLFKPRQKPLSSPLGSVQPLSPRPSPKMLAAESNAQAQPIKPDDSSTYPANPADASESNASVNAASPMSKAQRHARSHIPQIKDELLPEQHHSAGGSQDQTLPLEPESSPVDIQSVDDDDGDDMLSNINVASPVKLNPVTPTRSLPPRSTRANVSYSNSPRPKTPKTTTPRPKTKKQRIAENRLVDSDMASEQTRQSASRRIIKTDTARNRVREEIATKTKAKRDAFLVHHQDYFLPLLPPNNYVSKLLQARAKRQEYVPHVPLKKQPANVVATMKPYQLVGLSFMYNMFLNAMSAILGDEMGLGKTLQTLSLIQHLEETHPSPPGLPRPYLVVCPLSVLGSWCDEARKWTPKLRVLRFHGTAAERNQLKSVALGVVDRFGNETGRRKTRKRTSAPATEVSDGGATFDLMVTTYEAFQAENAWLKHAFVFRYVILDEGHKIKNDKTNVSLSLQGLQAEHRLLLTGTPLQNDLREMWALLHWLYPEVFTDKTADLFKNAFDIGRGQVDPVFMDNARHLLELIMIRRMKSSPGVDLDLPLKEEVLLYIPLTPVQRFWYTRLLTKAGDSILNELFGNVQQKEREALAEDLDEDARIDQAEAAVDPEHDFTSQSRALIQQAIANEATGEKDTSAYKKLMNIVMQLRKVSITSYMIKGAAPEPYTLGDHIMHASGKFVVLSKLVDELVLKQGKKILIFSGFTSALNYCEDLLVLKGSNQHNAPFRHVRFDGSTQRAVRNLKIKLFNDPTSDHRVMLISTRAGGLGLNLTAASDVIFLDEDWNPQVTLQAESRSHRIGQTKPVTIYKLLSSGTVEEQMMGRIRKKLYLSAKITESMQDIHSKPEQSATRKRGRQDDMSADDGPDLGFSQLKSLIRRGATTLAHPEINVNEMVTWDLETIIEKCKDKPVDPHVNDHAEEHVDEQEWLSKMERVESAVLDGVRYQRQIDREVIPTHDLSRADRRTGKNTTVMVNGFAINKESLNCGEWEAVPTLAGKDPRLASPKREKAPPINHQETCQICFDGGEVYLCSSCPRVYHLDCLPELYQAKATSRMIFICSQHNCIDCERNTNNAGGLIYRCRWCHRGYCEDCLDPRSQLLGDTLPEYEVLEFDTKQNAYYIHCHECHELEEADPETAKLVIEMKKYYDEQCKQHLEAQSEEDHISRDQSMTDGVTVESSGQITPQIPATKTSSHRMIVVDLTNDVVDLTETDSDSKQPEIFDGPQAIEGAAMHDYTPKAKKRRTH